LSIRNVSKTISNETTFETDIRDFVTLERILWRLSEKVSLRLKSGGACGVNHHAEIDPPAPLVNLAARNQSPRKKREAKAAAKKIKAV
jgi:nucleotidyltransferase/DNA polymerase involved in DNA repair